MVDSSFRITQINYGVKPTITLWEKDNRIGYDSDIPIIAAKDSNWKYEKEVRIYNEHNESGAYLWRFVLYSKLSFSWSYLWISNFRQLTKTLYLWFLEMQPHVRRGF